MIDIPPQPLYTRADIPLRTVLMREEVPMSLPQAAGWTRRRFLGGLTLAGTAGGLGLYARPVVAEPPPEIAAVRLVHQIGALCLAPQYIAKELLQSEGFTDVHYAPIEPGPSIYEILASGGADISMAFGAPVILRIDTGKPLVLLAGLHVGCFELFGNERVRTIRDLKGKTVSIPGLGSAGHIFLAGSDKQIMLCPSFLVQTILYSMCYEAATRQQHYLCSTTLAHATESTSLIRYRLCDTITAGLSRETLT
jgi:hypothetical protein